MKDPMTESPAHDVDCELDGECPGCHCACSYRASLVKLEREREEDRQAIRDVANLPYDDVPGGLQKFFSSYIAWGMRYGALIARARAQRP